jgi:hypothetical protein
MTAVYLMGSKNKVADQLSRLERAGDYSLTDKAIEMIQKEFQLTITLDAFATKTNKKCNQYISPTDDPEALGVYGLKQPWKCNVVLANPPLTLIGQVL